MSEKFPLSVQLGSHIRQLRDIKKLSQEKLAAAAELDRTYISGIERGVRNPSLKNLARIATALGVSLPELLTF